MLPDEESSQDLPDLDPHEEVTCEIVFSRSDWDQLFFEVKRASTQTPALLSPFLKEFFRELSSQAYLQVRYFG
jgi:hypothetical protein